MILALNSHATRYCKERSARTSLGRWVLVCFLKMAGVQISEEERKQQAGERHEQGTGPKIIFMDLRLAGLQWKVHTGAVWERRVRSLRPGLGRVFHTCELYLLKPRRNNRVTFLFQKETTNMDVQDDDLVVRSFRRLEIDQLGKLEDE